MQQNYVTIRPLNREDSVLYFPPEAFGPFRVLHQIGAGTLGPVFRAHDASRDRLVAIKVFRLDITPAQAAVLMDRFDRLIAAKIDHLNIAAPIAAGLESGVPFLVHEHVVGESLDVILRDRGPLSIDELVPVVDSLASAIDHAASRGVHHGALHPRDIILTTAGARMTGFGVADAVSRVSGKRPTRPLYSAPDAPSDHYSLGAIAFEALTGKRPSPTNVEEVRVAHGAELPDTLRVALDALASAGPNGPIAPYASAAPAALEVPLAPTAPIAFSASTVAHTPPSALVDEGDLDLRIDHPMALSPEVKAMLDPIDDVTASQGRRWPIVAIFLVFGVIAALSVGLFLRSPASVAVRDTKPGVNETIVDLPASPAPSAQAAKPALPAPAPSRSASGAIARPQPTRGSLLIRSMPADANVLVNGQSRGKTPLVIRNLALGSYTIRVARDGYVSEEQSLQLTPQRPTTATTFNLRTVPASAAVAGKPGGMTVRSRPPGARVFVNDRLIGSTPAMIPDLPAGSATVRLELEGYQTWATTVRVGAGEQTRVAASLERK